MPSTQIVSVFTADFVFLFSISNFVGENTEMTVFARLCIVTNAVNNPNSKIRNNDVKKFFIIINSCNL
jgi:hypothetical protein